MGKNIVVFSDGTGQEGGSEKVTNVYKLFNMVIDRSQEQVSFYDRGLGTGWRKISGNVGGAGISKNIKECYRFIFEHYQVGDTVFMFGFSRGATTVRSLSGFIHLFGILPKSRPELIDRAYRIYKIRDRKKRESKARKFVAQHHNMWCKIKFMGVWDTVDALGIPIKPIDILIEKVPGFRHKYHDLRLSKSVVHARHAIAIDDERLTFHPKIWDPEIYDGQTMKQVWFAGMHTDVGGGYLEQTLSDIPLVWMLREAKDHGLKIYSRHKVHIDQDENGVMHDSRGGAFTRFYRKQRRTWDTSLRGKPVVHESALKRQLNQQNEMNPAYSPWITDMEHEIEPWRDLSTEDLDN